MKIFVLAGCLSLLCQCAYALGAKTADAKPAAPAAGKASLADVKASALDPKAAQAPVDPKLAEHKAKITANLDNRIQILQVSRLCVAGAADKAALRSCYEAEKKDMMSAMKALKAERKELKAELKAQHRAAKKAKKTARAAKKAAYAESAPEIPEDAQ